MNKLIDTIAGHEGLRLNLYRCPAGKLTIGYGHNIEDNGISKRIARLMLEEDIEQARADLIANFPFVKDLNAARQDALINMVFNLGIVRFSKFKNMIAAIHRADFITASIEAIDSKWARQVGARADDIAETLKTGRYV